MNIMNTNDPAGHLGVIMEWVLSVGSAGKLTQGKVTIRAAVSSSTTYIVHIHTLLQQCMYTVATTYRVYV